MHPGKTILSLTTDLLAHGAFNHLTDDQVSALHHLIMRLKEPLSHIQQNLLLTFWANADATDLPPALIYRCNVVLQQFGRNPVGMLCVEMELE